MSDFLIDHAEFLKTLISEKPNFRNLNKTRNSGKPLFGTLKPLFGTLKPLFGTLLRPLWDPIEASLGPY